MLIDYTVIGKQIREFRKKKGWTQEKLAEESGIEPSNISHIERAATKVSLPTLIHIANALGVTADDLLYRNLKKSESVSVALINDLLTDCTPAELHAISEIIKTTKTILRVKPQ
ncbi:MAG: helix-turn-helix transcriptional regulator [Ruminococcaceae bacterium]|nr:helix-turn-helix transcriptional regulator [Oscillospiraceae bacterium]